MLELWEQALLAVADGCLLGGIIMFIFALFITHGGNIDHEFQDIGDISDGGDIGSSVEIGHTSLPEISYDIGDISDGGDIGSSVEIGHTSLPEISHDIDNSGHINHIHGDHNLETISDSSPAPILLLLSSFMLSYGIMGEILFNLKIDSLLRVLLIFGIPIALTKGISVLWKKLAKEQKGYEIPQVKIDNQVETLTRVDTQGGLVLADTSDIDRAHEKLHLLGKIKMQAKTLPGTEILANSIAYVIDIDNHNTLIIDKWPSSPKKNQKNI